MGDKITLDDNIETPQGDEDILKIFGDDEEIETPEDDEEVDESVSEEKEDESDEKEEEEEEPKLEDESEDWNVPTLEAITKKYPEITKEFPGLKNVLEREAEFSQVFQTPEEAEEALENSKTYQEFESELLSGNIEKVLKSVKESDSNAYDKIVNDLFPTLRRVDERAYGDLLANVIKATSSSMFQAADGIKDEQTKNNLQAAARILNQFALGTTEIIPPKVSKSAQEDPKNKELEEKEKAFNDRQFKNAKENLDSRIEKVLGNSIDKYLDPKQQMTAYVRGKAKDDIISKLDAAIGSDARFKKNLDALWKNSFDDNFSTSTIDKIKKAYLSKAETLLPQIMREVRAAAMKGSSKRLKEKEEKGTPRKRINTEKTKNNTNDTQEKKTSRDIRNFIMKD